MRCFFSGGGATSGVIDPVIRDEISSTLFAKTNGALLEWLNSPIVYCERGSLAADLRALSERALNEIFRAALSSS